MLFAQAVEAGSCFAGRELAAELGNDEGVEQTPEEIAVAEHGGAIDRRELWRPAGVSFDALSASVLAPGLRPTPDSPYTRSCLERTLAGTPDLLTLHGLQRHPLRFPGVAVVFSCENRTVIEAAASALGAQAPPPVCTSGWPNSAVCLLFEMLIAGGAEIRHHGDFEWVACASGLAAGSSRRLALSLRRALIRGRGVGEWDPGKASRRATARDLR